MTQNRSISKAVTAVFILAVLGGFALMFVGGVASLLVNSGKKALSPESYWSDEVAKIEARFKTMSEDLRTCQAKVLQSDREATELYSTFIKQGWQSDQAMDLVTARRKGLENVCNNQMDKMILEVKKHADAKVELQKHSQ